jgi:5-oxoprolinase (ATP-hydrolysing) subunit A
LCWGAGLADKVKGHCLEQCPFLFSMRIDLNADVGESAAQDRALVRIVTSVNIACGFHAGTPTTIREYLRLAREHAVAAGAHPSLADRDELGRRALPVPPAEVENLVLYQISALRGIASVESMRLSHVKPHGALYHMAAADELTADAVARAIALSGRDLHLVAFAGSLLIRAGKRAGLTVTAEAFVDRAYAPDGRLVPRDQADALIHDPAKASAQALRIVLEGQVRANDGSTLISVAADTLCIHSDTPGAVIIADAVRTALEKAGVTVAAPD